VRSSTCFVQSKHPRIAFDMIDCVPRSLHLICYSSLQPSFEFCILPCAMPCTVIASALFLERLILVLKLSCRPLTSLPYRPWSATRLRRLNSPRNQPHMIPTPACESLSLTAWPSTELSCVSPLSDLGMVAGFERDVLVTGETFKNITNHYTTTPAVPSGTFLAVASDGS
jgi:hypothetical protein